MFLDIWAWGWLMRRDFLPDSFSVLGRCILAGMTTLIVCSWPFGADWIQAPKHQLLFAGAVFLALLLVGQLAGMALDYFQPRTNRESPAANG
jgi:hypothetical protein